MSMTTSSPVHPVLNRDREEIRVPNPFGHDLQAYLTRKGLRANVRTDAAGDLLTLVGEPDMGRVKSLLTDWESNTNPGR
jgi:hypothetical protein